MEHFPGDEPLEAAQNFIVAEHFCRGSFGIGVGLLLQRQSHHRDRMQGGVDLADAALVQAVMPFVAGADLHVSRVAYGGACRFRANQPRVIADCHPQHSGCVNINTIGIAQPSAAAWINASRSFINASSSASRA